jgi:hypothetical protein
VDGLLAKLARDIDSVENVSVDEKGELHLTALDRVVPGAAKRLQRRLERRIPLTDLLNEVDRWAGFLGHFTHLVHRRSSWIRSRTPLGRVEPATIVQNDRAIIRSGGAPRRTTETWRMSCCYLSAKATLLSTHIKEIKAAGRWPAAATGMRIGRRVCVFGRQAVQSLARYGRFARIGVDAASHPPTRRARVSIGR